MKRLVLLSLFLLTQGACKGQDTADAETHSVDLSEYDISALQQAMQGGELSASKIVEFYLAEIQRIDDAGPQLNAIIELNPDALDIALALDEERAKSGPRSDLHGIPVVLKANIDTGDRMHTTAGSLALADHIAKDDAFLVARLREAGAIILGKANLSEWANFRSRHSSSGWSSIGGQTRNAYDPRRNPCGSSSGSAVAVSANLTVLAVGTETDGSVVCPAGINGVVGIKPSLGLVSRDGIIPIGHSQDTAGPMARTVKDAAIMLTAMAAEDHRDVASPGRPASIPDYAAALSTDGLKGKRIGIVRTHYGAGEIPKVEAVLSAAIEILESQGAIIVDPIELATEGMGEAEREVLIYEFKAELGVYLQETDTGLRTLQDVIDFNQQNAERVMPFFGQDRMESAIPKGDLIDPAYLTALADSKRISQNAINTAIDAHDLDAMLAPTNGPAWLTDHINGDSFGLSSSSFAAVSGYASITVPAGFVQGLPVGVSFFAGNFSEKQLIEMAYAFEQASKIRRAPNYDSLQ